MTTRQKYITYSFVALLTFKLILITIALTRLCYLFRIFSDYYPENYFGFHSKKDLCISLKCKYLQYQPFFVWETVSASRIVRIQEIRQSFKGSFQRSLSSYVEDL